MSGYFVKSKTCRFWIVTFILSQSIFFPYPTSVYFTHIENIGYVLFMGCMKTARRYASFTFTLIKNSGLSIQFFGFFLGLDSVSDYIILVLEATEASSLR